MTETKQYGSLREKIRAEKEARADRYRDFRVLIAAAHTAGLNAGRECIPSPMHVYDGYSREHIETVSDGMCGFAWIKIRPATSSFARYLVKDGFARPSYTGGIEIWISAHNQSYERKMAHARAAAKVLQDAGISAYADGRLD